MKMISVVLRSLIIVILSSVVFYFTVFQGVLYLFPGMSPSWIPLQMIGMSMVVLSVVWCVCHLGIIQETLSEHSLVIGFLSGYRESNASLDSAHLGTDELFLNLSVGWMASVDLVLLLFLYLLITCMLLGDLPEFLVFLFDSFKQKVIQLKQR